jgi:hypothetical protein
MRFCEWHLLSLICDFYSPEKNPGIGMVFTCSGGRRPASARKSRVLAAVLPRISSTAGSLFLSLSSFFAFLYSVCRAAQ